MSDSDTDLDLDLDDTDQDGSPDTDADGDGSGAPPTGDPATGDGNESKRISDLTSKWQKAEARAERAEKALKTGKGPTADRDGDEIPEAVRRWMDAAKEGARERWFNSDPRFAAYGLEQALIDGGDPDAMQAAAKRLSALIDGVESKARQKVLDEHGLSAEFAGSASAPKYDFSSMSDEDFKKFLDKRG